MGYLEGIDWKKLKKDMQHGVEKGIVAVKQGAMVARKKAEALTEEGKRQYRIMTLKSKVHSGISDLGAKVYSLLSRRSGNPALDARVKGLVAQIRKYETQIAALEKKRRPAGRKKSA